MTGFKDYLSKEMSKGVRFEDKMAIDDLIRREIYSSHPQKKKRVLSGLPIKSSNDGSKIKDSNRVNKK